MKIANMKYYKRERLFDYIFTRFLICIIIGLLILLFFIIKSVNHNSMEIKEQQKERKEIFIAYDNHDKKVIQKIKELETFNQYITPIPNTIEMKETNNRILVESKYKYAMYDKANIRNDLTTELIVLGEQLMTENNLDPNLLFGIIMVESEGHSDSTNPVSGAAGLGQFLPDTGQFIYNKYINKNDQYDHTTTPYDAENNLKMIVYYLDYLYSVYDGSTMDVLKEYCGGDDNFTLSYYNKVCNEVGYCIN